VDIGASAAGALVCIGIVSRQANDGAWRAASRGAFPSI
jgi:hypothetical protein